MCGSFIQVCTMPLVWPNVNFWLRIRENNVSYKKEYIMANGFVVKVQYKIDEQSTETTDKIVASSVKGGDFVYLSSQSDELSMDQKEFLADSFCEGAELSTWNNKQSDGSYKYAVKGGHAKKPLTGAQRA